MSQLHTATYSTPPQNIWDHVRRTLSLAIPVMIARAGLVLMVTVDSIMVGQQSARQLAFYAIGFAPHVFLLVAGLGLLIGTIILTAQADGAERYEETGGTWHSALIVAGLVGLVTGTIMQFGESILLLFGQTPGIASGGAEVLRQFAWGMPTLLMFIATSFFLEGINRPRAGMVISLTGVAVNAILNWLLIYGHMGFPEMGAAGAALATTITRTLMFLALAGYVLNMPGAWSFGVRSWAPGALARLKKLLVIGVPLSLAVSSESASFALVATFAGRLGETSLAAYQIGLNVVSIVFMLAIGLSTATSVRVANAIGKRDRPRMATAGWTGAGLSVIFMLVAGVVILLLRPEVAAIYTEDAPVLSIAIPVLAMVSVVVLSDGVQAVLMGALRGVSDVFVPTLMQAFSFWCVSVPVAYLVGLNLGHGVLGLMTGILAGLTVASALLFTRFLVVSRRPLA